MSDFEWDEPNGYPGNVPVFCYICGNYDDECDCDVISGEICGNCGSPEKCGCIETIYAENV